MLLQAWAEPMLILEIDCNKYERSDPARKCQGNLPGYCVIGFPIIGSSCPEELFHQTVF